MIVHVLSNLSELQCHVHACDKYTAIVYEVRVIGVGIALALPCNTPRPYYWLYMSLHAT